MNAISTMDPGTQFRAVNPPPLDVLQHFAPASLRTMSQVIQAAVDRIADAALKPLSPAATGAFSQTRAVLALLADCYARQIYSSAIVAAVALRDGDFLRQWPGDLPDAHALRRLRVENRGTIHRGLMAALRFQAEQKISAGALTKIDVPQLAEEASRRIIMAAFVDSMELDGE